MPEPQKRNRRLRPPTLSTLLVLTGSVALYCSSFVQDRRIGELRQTLITDLECDGFYTSSPGSYDWPLHTRWLHRLLGDDYPASLGCVTYGPFATIDDRTIDKLVEFHEIYCIQFDGEIFITDAGIQKLRLLKNLEELYLGNADVSPAAVAELQAALPRCQIQWDSGDWQTK